MSDPADISHPGEEGRASPHARYTKQSGTAIDILADDLLVEILSRVPAKSLLRFRCVSSHWLALIDHPDHRKRLPQTPAGFFYDNKYTVEWFLQPPLHFTSFPGKRCPPIDTSCSFLPNHERIHLLDCCNGLLLCRWCDASAEGEESRYVVCNPATEKWVVLPSSGKATSEVATARLGFDPALSPHFHVFELVEEQEPNWHPHIAGVAVYSSQTGGWVYKEQRWNKQIRPIDRLSTFVFLDGYLHFQANARRLSSHLAVVDTEGETWMSFSVPGGLVDGFIQRSQGRLHYANFQRGGDSVIRLVVYVLNDYQSRKWILKHSIEASHIFRGMDAYLEGGFDWIAMDFDWITIHPECNTIFFTAGWGTTFMCYNMDLQQVKVISNLEDGWPAYLTYVPLYAELQSLHAL
ncbi:F-box protein At5g07610 [Aegilops tauschii subsp. strangulata]|uniref:F-box protein At5g07610 n=1 Tax=Aegilops tauschii subsp. strangulata TaxID=200361 RepID=UPI00098BAAE0